MKETTPIYQSKDYPNFHDAGYFYQLIQNRLLTNVAHRHDFFEIALLLQGNAVQNIDGASAPMQALQFTFLAPQNAHYFEKQSESIYVFSLSVLSEKFTKFLSAFEFSPIYGKVYDCKDKTLIEEILQLPANVGKRQKFAIHSILTKLFFETLSEPLLKNDAVPLHLQLAIEKIRQPNFICGGVDQFAELAGYSRMHLGRLLKKHYGKTPIAFLQDVRMSLAAEYLQKTSFTLDAIASRIGFSSLSQFHAAFKRQYGCTPHAYRKKKTSALVTT